MMNEAEPQRIDLTIPSSHSFSRHDLEIYLGGKSSTEEKVRPRPSALFDHPMIFTEPIIDHQWEQRSAMGHLVVSSGDFVAYALKPQSGDDIVCVFYKQVDFRSVINPPFRGDIQDLAFSFSDDLLLACVDQACHLRIYSIEKIDEPNELEHTLMLHLDLQYNSISAPPTISWCCFIPESNDDDEENDASTMMSITRGSNVEVIHVDRVSPSSIPETMLRLNELDEGHLTYADHRGNVISVCFSPDGTALGTATDQGEIKFFSINFEQADACRCLHVWIPHDGRPISSLFFLDDHLNLTQETQLWRYAITGCDNNRELKVWSCTNWSCLQSLRFHDPSIETGVSLKISIDLTSRFLVLSDLHRNSFIVLTIYQDSEQNNAHISSIHAFSSLASPSLSSTITAANQLFHSNASHESISYAVKMYSIHSDSFQEILFVMNTKPFTALLEPETTENNIVEDFRFEPLIDYLRTEPIRTTPINHLIPMPTYSIDDLLTPSSQDGLLLGNRTAFDHEEQSTKDDPNGNPRLSPPKYSERRLNSQGMENYSDPTETSDKDNDSTADEETHLHPRPKRRTGRSPNSSIHSEIVHEIRQLSEMLRNQPRRVSSESEEKLEQCCQQLDELTSKVDRLISSESAMHRPSRPSPSSATPVNAVAIGTSNEEEFSDFHSDRLENFLRERIPMTMNTIFEPYQQLKDHLHKDLAGKLLATDAVIKQALGQMFRSKNMIDSLSQAVAHTVQSNIVTCYRDTFNQLVIPSFEKAATNMFQQTNDVFKRGTKEYLQEMIEYGRQQQRTLIQQREQIMSEIKKECLLLNKEVEKRNQHSVDGLKSDLTEPLVAVIRQKTSTILREETTEIFRDLFNSQKSDLEQLLQSTPPTVPSLSDLRQDHIIQYLRQGQYNRAFEFALSASDLSLVLFVCEQVSPKDLFTIQPCPLQTSVLLSLIQQLSADLTTHQDLKVNYLSEALICLDLSHPTVRDYSHNVLSDLTKRLTLYLQTTPTNAMTKRFQLLWMTSQGLVQQLNSH